MSIETRIANFKCYKCEGTGKIVNKKCDVCDGTGIYKESTYYFINDKTGQCWMGDTLK